MSSYYSSNADSDGIAQAGLSGAYDEQVDAAADEALYDLDSDDDFLVEEGDDEDSFDLIEPGSGSPPPAYYPGIQMCVICRSRPAYSKGGKSFPTCGLTCASELQDQQQNGYTYTPSPGGSRRGRNGHQGRSYSDGYGYAAPQDQSYHTYVDPNLALLSRHLQGVQINDASDQQQVPGSSRNNPYYQPAVQTPPRHRTLKAMRRPAAVVIQPVQPRPPRPQCVICKSKPCHDNQYVTCGLTCARKLCQGGRDKNMCSYCHRKPKLSGHEQCGQTCRDNAKVACLLCKTRPKHGRFHLCGKTCKLLATENTPLLLEAPKDHTTYNLVEKKFASSWKAGGTAPTIKAIFKIIENKSFLMPYDQYKKKTGPKTEVFRYHGTSRRCTLGTGGNTTLCSQATCALCNILKTSFKVSLAKTSGAFGAGVYSSSASNKAYSYAGSAGAMLLCKVVLGNIRTVQNWNEVMSCPTGYNSVVFDRQNGSLNETIVYSDDAIRPVFLVLFN